MTNWLIKLLPLTVLFAIGTIVPPSNAQIQGNDDRLITIESDTQSADNITGVVTALGNVRIVYPSRGMVATSRQAQYFSKAGDDFKSSSLFRFFMARDADFEIKQNPYANRHPEDVWNSATGQYATYSNNFGQHHQ